MHHRLHALSAGHRVAALRSTGGNHRPDTCLHYIRALVTSRGRQYPWGKWGGQKSCGACSIPVVRLLYRAGLLMFHILGVQAHRHCSTCSCITRGINILAANRWRYSGCVLCLNRTTFANFVHVGLSYAVADRRSMNNRRPLNCLCGPFMKINM